MSILSRQEWDRGFYKRNLKGEEALAAVRQHGLDLRYVAKQTDEICLAAVRKNGCALQHVHNQTKAICLVAVKQNRLALRYVEERFLDDSLPDVKVDIAGKEYKLTDKDWDEIVSDSENPTPNEKLIALMKIDT